MKTIHLVDPELRGMTDASRSFTFSKENLPAIRERFNALKASQPKVNITGVTVEEKFIESADKKHKIRLLVYTPENNNTAKPALLYIHGGGYVMGTADINDGRNKGLSEELGAVVVSVEYRLAPEFPFPIPLEDCYSTLKWMHTHATELGIDKNNMAVYGESAGGGLAAALSLLVRDRKELSLRHQFLIYPMLDDRTVTEKNSNAFTGEFIWTRDTNTFGWTSYLKEVPGSDDISHYAAPARAENPEGLAPAFVAVGGLDLFLDENMNYAHRLIRAGVSTDLHVYAGAIHGFIDLPDPTISKQFDNDFRAALKKALVK